MNNLQTAIRKLPTVLVTGANGQLGHKISELLSANCKLIMTDFKEMDITDSTKVLEFIETNKPDWIVHGAAYTKVDLAEDEVEICTKINVNGTKNLAEAAAKFEVPIIYISTDYVFDGKKDSPYTESDTAKPLNVYGRTKLDGEKIIQQICKKYYILRVAWLFGELPENYAGTNFIETMLRLSKERDTLSVVNDQIGSPTYTKDLVEIIDQIIRIPNPGLRSQDLGHSNKTTHLRPKTKDLSPIPYGLYHFSGNGKCSWYDFAKEIFCLAKIVIDLKPTTSDQYPQKAKRPCYTYLSKEKIEKALDLSARPWQDMVKEYLENKN